MSMTYKKAGVDIAKADSFVDAIKPFVRSTERKEVLGTIGAFAGFFKPNIRGMKEPVLVSSTDGVGTKLLIAEAQKKYDTVGIDLVAMCVNDVVVTGAEPLLFLDYIAIGRIETAKMRGLVKGMAEGCKMANCAIVGGETAELPGMYRDGEFDLAGFAVGIVDKKKILDGRGIKEGDRVLGFASSGLHSNGYSLARRLFTERELKGQIGRLLLRPTIIYVRPVLELLRNLPAKSFAHITGGGFYDNIPRVLPKGLTAEIKLGSWPVPPIFRIVQGRGSIKPREMFHTLNMGIGMISVMGPSHIERARKILRRFNIPSYEIGRIVRGGEVHFV
ncbi:MAG: phosphoribosylformylglycinamidine cyclo-ligase [Candidatus Omnitrophica bacterium]|nr:phosphoribosylformylglycinamidine cyclo-ligase [Candidatus Omnitrophota bacterium]